jgi:hypothetical protein
MKLQWMTAAVLSSALAVGCGDRGNQNAQNSNENTGAPAATAPADTDQSTRNGEAVSPGSDTGTRQESNGTANRRTPTTRSSERRESTRTVDRPATPPEWNNSAATSATSERAAAAATPTLRELTIPAGTQLPLELMTALSSETAQVETPVRAKLRTPLTVNGYTAVPAGTVLSGTVTEVGEAGRVKGRSHLTFRFDEAQVNGVRERLRTNPITVEADASKGQDATKIGAGAGIGAAIGGLLGGGKGAAKGAAIGGAAGTGAVLATRGKDVELAEGADVSATLASDLTVRVPDR